MQIIYNRMKHDLIQTMPTSQAAYQQGRGTVEQIQSIQQSCIQCVPIYFILYLH